MSPLRCCHCGRRLVRAAGMTDRGPVGPVCAVKLGLPREVPMLRRDGLPRQRAVRVRLSVALPELDPRQLALELTA